MGAPFSEARTMPRNSTTEPTVGGGAMDEVGMETSVYSMEISMFSLRKRVG